MPLHLLGKKSWNVYNSNNIARVKRDEGEARAKQEAKDHRTEEVEAQRRLAILRGEIEPSSLDDYDDSDKSDKKLSSSYETSQRSRSSHRHQARKRPGENDTDYEFRLAKQRMDRRHTETQLSHQAKVSESAKLSLSEDQQQKRAFAGPITDATRHINLFGTEPGAAAISPAARHGTGQNKEAHDLSIPGVTFESLRRVPTTWYNSASALIGDASDNTRVGSGAASMGQDYEDPRKLQREAARLVAHDPLAMMKQGSRKVRELKNQRKGFIEAQRAEIRSLDQAEEKEREKEKKKYRERNNSRSKRHSGGGNESGRARTEKDEVQEREQRRRHRTHGTSDARKSGRGREEFGSVASHRYGRDRSRSRSRSRDHDQGRP